MKILGFSGKARHGKDTCAQIAREIALEELGKQVGSWAFAHPLKANVFGEANGEFSVADIWETKPPQVRTMLQQRGTEQGREKYGEDVWVLQSQAYVHLFTENFPMLDGLTFTDVRFPNEVGFIKAGGKAVDPALALELERRYVAGGYAGQFDWEALDPVEANEFEKLLQFEQQAAQQMYEYAEELLSSPDGMALYIQSDRPTLTGKDAQHLSEIALDDLDKEEAFDGIINNNLDVTFEDLRDQLRPYVKQLFES